MSQALTQNESELKEKKWWIRRIHLQDYIQTHCGLPFAIYYLSRNQIKIIQTKLAKGHLLDFVVDVLQSDNDIQGLWVSHRVVNLAQGISTMWIDKAVAKYGAFAWAPEFENENSIWNVENNGFDWQQIWFPSALHFYEIQKLQQKFRSKLYMTELAAKSNQYIKEWGRNLSSPMREDSKCWQERRVSVMRQAMSLQLKNDNQVQSLLDATYGLPLIFLSDDAYWGYPGDNYLGKILQRCRETTEINGDDKFSSKYTKNDTSMSKCFPPTIHDLKIEKLWNEDEGEDESDAMSF